MSSVLHTVAGLKSAAGGVSRSVPRLCEAIAQERWRTLLVTQRPRDAASAGLRLPEPSLVELTLVDGYDWERLRVSYTPGLAAILAARCRAASPLAWHDHGVWLHSNHVAAQVSRRMKVPRVVSPRGMLEGWSMRYRGWRKRAAWHAYQRADLAAAQGFSATSLAEACALRELGFRQPIAVIPNGIDVPAAIARKDPGRATRAVLFMSRLHPKKGLLELVEAWSLARPPGWRLVIAGSDERGHAAQVRAAAERAGVLQSMEFPGHVDGERKARALADADLFVLPSHSENFGIVVGEALAHGVPVITTTATPWEVIVTEGCGWRVEPRPEALAAALTAAASLSDAARAAMGAKGRDLVAQRFSWQGAARRHIAFYSWLHGGGPTPEWVHS